MTPKSNSRNHVRRQKTLKGYLIILNQKEAGEFPLALNYGPSMVGLNWSFDWLGRASVFATKGLARKVIRKHVTKPAVLKQAKIVPVASLCVMIPDVNLRGNLFYRCEPKGYIQPIKERASGWQAFAARLEAEAKKDLARASQIRRSAEVLLAAKAKSRCIWP